MKLLKFLMGLIQVLLCLGNPNRPLTQSHEDFIDTHEDITSFIGDLADMRTPPVPREDVTLEDTVEDILERRSGSHHLFEHDVVFHCKHPKDINCRKEMNEHCEDPTNENCNIAMENEILDEGKIRLKRSAQRSGICPLACLFTYPHFDAICFACSVLTFN